MGLPAEQKRIVDGDAMRMGVLGDECDLARALFAGVAGDILASQHDGATLWANNVVETGEQRCLAAAVDTEYGEKRPG